MEWPNTQTRMAVMACMPLMNSDFGPEPTGLTSYCWDELSETAPAPRRESPESAPGFELDLRIVLGRTSMRLDEVLRLRSGSVVVLDKRIGDPVEIHVNNRLIAYGEVLVLEGKFCIRVTEMVGSGG